MFPPQVNGDIIEFADKSVIEVTKDNDITSFNREQQRHQNTTSSTTDVELHPLGNDSKRQNSVGSLPTIYEGASTPEQKKKGNSESAQNQKHQTVGIENAVDRGKHSDDVISSDSAEGGSDDEKEESVFVVFPQGDRYILRTPSGKEKVLTPDDPANDLKVKKRKQKG